ncbi:MAG: peptidoglycan endopeptidase [Paraburkholderia sp.]|nr:MAG: peptidoglycan endopeptidase [Paraburkholderia sp.]
MLRFWLILLVVLSLAACSSAPPKAARAVGSPSRGENALRTMPPGSPRFVDHSIGREEISIQAMSLVGIPYHWGGNTPDSGFDCSGLVRYVVARAADVELPRTTADMSHRGESIEPDEVAPGDLIFFNTTGRPHSHVGIYVGKLRFVNAPSTGGTVRLDYLTNPYWAKRFDGIRRVAAPLEPPSPFDAPTRLAARQAPPAAKPPVEAATGTASIATPGVATQATAARPPTLAGASGAASVEASDAPAQAASIGSTTPSPIAGNAATHQAAAPTPAPAAEDPIDAVADAFEPPPAAAQAARQARRAGALSIQPGPHESTVQIMRASAMPRTQNAPSSTSDDPIAQFANSRE